MIMAWKGIVPPPSAATKNRHGGLRRRAGWEAEQAVRVRAEKIGVVYDPSHWSIYIFEVGGSDAIKIGRAASVAKRLTDLLYAHPGEVRAFGAFTADPPSIKKLEREFHRRLMFDPRHLAREWYRMPPADAVGLICGFAAELGVAIQESLQFPIGDLTARISSSTVVIDPRYENCAPSRLQGVTYGVKLRGLMG